MRTRRKRDGGPSDTYAVGTAVPVVLDGNTVGTISVATVRGYQGPQNG